MILIAVGIVFLAGSLLGFNVIDVIGSIFGSIFGAIGSIIGAVFGTIGSIFGAVFGTLGSIIGGLGDAFGSVVGGIFGTVGSVADIGWPFFIILPGLAMLALALFGPVSVVAFAIPGMVVSGTGMILLFQSMTDRWETWAYLWALYPIFVGVAMTLMASRTGNTALAAAARRVTLIGAALTLGFGVFFELLFSDSFDMIFSYGVPAALIIGGYLLLRKRDAAPVLEKPKHDLAYVGPLPEKPKHDNKYGIRPDLARQINEALEDDDTL
jgi:hypothetical protein